MSDFLQNLDLSRDAFHIFLIVDLFLLKDFDSHLSSQSKSPTFSPVRMCVPCLTWPNVPFPSPLPSKSVWLLTENVVANRDIALSSFHRVTLLNNRPPI